MTVTFSVLVVANRTADSPELLDALRERAEKGPVRFTLLAPAKTGREDTQQQLDAGIERMRASGLEVEGRIGDKDPVSAVDEVWDPGEFDEIIVSTLPEHTSKWLSIDLPRRIGKPTDALVTHVIASESAASSARTAAASSAGE